MTFEIQLHKFNPFILEKKRMSGHSPIVVFIGKRGTGKSTLIDDNMFHIRNIPIIIIMSGTEEGNGFYSKRVHKLFIYTKFEPAILEKILINQKRKVEELRQQGEDVKNHPEIGIGIIMDDLQADSKMMKNPHLREIFFNGRHFHITLFLSFQYMMGMPPEFRTNVDYIFACKETRNDNIDRLYKYFFSIFEKQKDFKKVLEECTNDYGCLVIDNTSRSSKIEDQVFWYKATPGHNYKIAEHNWKEWDKQLKLTNYTEQEKEELKKISIVK